MCGLPSKVHTSTEQERLEVEIEQQPWAVSIGRFPSQLQWNHECSGSLLTTKHVLTAATCIYGAQANEVLQKRYNSLQFYSTVLNAYYYTKL